MNDKEKDATDAPEEGTAADIEDITGDELAEIAGDELVDIAGDELDEVAGGELDEIAGDELDEVAGDELVDIAGDELDEVAGDELDEIAGGELDEIVSDELNEPAGMAKKPPQGALDPDPEEAVPTQTSAKRAVNKRDDNTAAPKAAFGKWFLWAAVGLVCFAAAVAGFFFIAQEEGGAPLMLRFAIGKRPVIVLNGFVIPFKNEHQYAYLALNIGIKLPNAELEREIQLKRDQLRGILYERLRKEIQKADAVPKTERLKAIIAKVVNSIMSIGKVTEVYITDILAV